MIVARPMLLLLTVLGNVGGYNEKNRCYGNDLERRRETGVPGRNNELLRVR